MKEERLFFDVFELAPAAGSSIGIYTYAKQLFRALVSVPRPGLTVVVACNARALVDFQPGDSGVRVEFMVLSSARPGTARRLAWTFFEAALRMRISKSSIYYSPRGFLPYGLTRLGGSQGTIVTIHDLIPLWYREHFPSHFGRFHQWFICTGLVRGATKADLVITISDASAADIRARTETTAPVRRIYNGMDDEAVPEGNGPRDYFLAMTSSLPHKNAECILRAYDDYRKRSATPLELVICGLRGAQGTGVNAVSGLSDVELRELYRGARAFVFMSLAEGFGFPPLEAMACGTATICSDIPVLREITRGAAVYVDPMRSDLLSQELSRLEAMPDDLNQVALRRSVANSYSWRRCAHEFFYEIGSLARRSSAS